MKVGDLRQVTADCITLEGESVSRLANDDGAVRELLTPGLFPGETGQVRIEALSRHHPKAFGRLVELTQPHAERRTPPCPNHPGNGGRCSGCALMALDEPAQRETKRAMLHTQFGLEVATLAPSAMALGYRLSSKRVALRMRGRLVLGSFARGTHVAAPMPGCLVDHPLLVAAFEKLERACEAQQVRPYDERSGQGDLRAVWAKTNGQQVIVTLVVAGDDSRAAELLPPLLESCQGVLVSVQRGTANALRGEAARLVRGQAEVVVRLLGQTVEVGALGFLQPNPEVAEQAYRALVAPTEGPRALAFDLYAGAGITTRALREHYAEVVPCESYPESAAQLGIPPRSVEAFLAEALQGEARVPELVIANPPRKGLGRAVSDALLALAAPELRIMSCGPEGLARDLAQLTAGGYRLEALYGFDTLPQTPHVELVAVLRR